HDGSYRRVVRAGQRPQAVALRDDDHLGYGPAAVGVDRSVLTGALQLVSWLEHRGLCDAVGCREGRDGDLVSASDGPEAVTPCHSDDEGLERLLACQQLQLLARMYDGAFQVIEGDEVGHPDAVRQCYVVEVVACPNGDGNRLGGRGRDSFTRHVEDHANADR